MVACHRYKVTGAKSCKINVKAERNWKNVQWPDQIGCLSYIYACVYACILLLVILILPNSSSGKGRFHLLSLMQVAKEGKLEKFEIPVKVKVLPEPWTPESGLVTAAMKLKREALRKAFADELVYLYS